MHRSRSSLTLALTAVLLAAAIPTAITPAATAQANDTEELDRSFHATGADTVAFELEAGDAAETLQTSELQVTATYHDEPQRVALVAGLVHEKQGASCPGGGDDACFLDQVARTMEDVALSSQPDGNGDLRADTGPGADVALETGHDHDTFTGVSFDRSFESYSLVDSGTYHLFVTVPGADELNVNLDFLVRDLAITDETVVDAGFAHWIDDMRAAGAHTALGNAYVGNGLACGAGCGEVTVDVGQGEQLFGAIGPSQNGLYNVHSDPTGNYCEDCFGPIPATFVGQWGASWPGNLRSGTGVGIVSGASPNAAVVPVPGASGDTTFFVQEYASLGPQDLAAAGFVDPG